MKDKEREAGSGGEMEAGRERRELNSFQ